ncbi:MAG: hypothetical protein KC619_24145 [Myxococcales bacterium]|nr:hypothetical protein [Myxococcales bacterium]
MTTTTETASSEAGTKTEELRDNPTWLDVGPGFRRKTFTPRVVAFPGDARVRIRVRVLSEHELDLARVRALEHCVKHRVDIVADERAVFEREVKRQIVWWAFLSEKPVEGEEARFFAKQSDVRDDLDRNTLDDLFDLYLDVQAEVTLSQRTLAAEVADKAIAVGRKDPAGFEVLLASADASSLRVLAKRLLARLGERSGGDDATDEEAEG